jgi:hypothetical protein
LDFSKTVVDLVMFAEVETAESTGLQEVPQWRDYARRASIFGKPFYLYVPLGCGVAARSLSRGLQIADIYEYWAESGVDRFRFAPPSLVVGAGSSATRR